MTLDKELRLAEFRGQYVRSKVPEICYKKSPFEVNRRGLSLSLH